MRPFGAFVHHQGRGHAERIAAIANALPAHRSMTVFCARDDIFPAMPDRVRIQRIPSLFEVPDIPARLLDEQRTPPTMHCAPVGWPSIREAVATMTTWFRECDPALFLVDVSAEMAQLARLASVPVVKVLQHGDRDDPGHMAAYEAAVGLLAPYHASLEQPGRPHWMSEKTFHAAGIGVSHEIPTREAARDALGLDASREIVLVVSGGGGAGAPVAPLTVGARARPEALWVTIGPVAREWHETDPGNLQHEGWVENADMWIAAADIVVASCGNTTVHMIAAAGRPYLVVPEWRYFAEQHRKAEALSRVGAAHLSQIWPASPAAWTAALEGARRCDIDIQRGLVGASGAADVAAWLEGLARRLWEPLSAAGEEREAAE